MNPLPEKHPVIIMTEHEYSDELDDNKQYDHNHKRKGKGRAPPESDHRNHSPRGHGDEKGTRQRTEKADSTDRLSINADSNKVKAPTSTRHDIAECQPTSSKVLMEDLVTDADDDAHEHEFHYHIDSSIPHRDESPNGTQRTRFWDRPTSSSTFAWPGDHRMPTEWNMVVSEMWKLDPNSKGTLFNYPDIPAVKEPERDINNRLSFLVPSTNVETDEPYEFTKVMYPDDRHREFLRRAMTLGPEIGKTSPIIVYRT